MNAEICWAVNDLSSILTDQSDPMWRLTERMVRSTLVTACRFATSPTRTSPFFANATTDGVVRAPSALAMTVGSPPSRTATTEFVVPRSMPTARAMIPTSTLSDPAALVGCSAGLVVSLPDVFRSPGEFRASGEFVKQVEPLQLNLAREHNGWLGLPIPGTSCELVVPATELHDVRRVGANAGRGV